AKKLVALDRGDYTHGAFFARLGALHAAKAADAHGAGHGNFVGQGQENLDRRAFFDVLGKIEIDTARANVPRFGAGFADGSARRPANREWQPHAKALCGAAFGTRQDKPPDRSQSVSGVGLGHNRTPDTKTIQSP